MNRRLAGRLVSIVAAVAILTFACASPPTAEKEAAEAAVSAARAAGADRYAATEFAAAADALKQADTLMQAKKYSEAKPAYVKAKELAGKAEAAVEAGKVAMRAQVESELATVEKRWQELDGKMNGVAKRLKAEQKQAWEVEAKNVLEALQASRAAVGDDPLAARQKVGPVVAALDKWEAEAKALTTPVREAKKPGKPAPVKKKKAK